MTIVVFPASAALLRPSSSPFGRTAGRQPPRFLARSNARGAAAASTRLGVAVVSPLFSCRPWLQNDPAIQLGWDHAHHGVRPTLDALCANAALKQGYQAGVAVFGRRTLKLTPYVKPWLALRLEALERGRYFDVERVNPRYIQQLFESTGTPSLCPVTRQPLDAEADDTMIVRLRPDLDYVAGNLLVMSRSAWLGMSRSVALQIVAAPTGQEAAAAMSNRLDAADSERLGVLRSFGEALPHGMAARIPLLVMPPNRLRMRNPIQALQAVVSRSLACGTEAFARLRAAMPGKSVRDDVDAFAAAFVGAFTVRSATSRDEAITHCWTSAAVQQAWQQLASHLDADQAERLVARIVDASSDGFSVSVTPDDDAPAPRLADQAIRLHA